MQNKTVFASAILGVALIASALVFGLFFYEARRSVHTVKVVGIGVQRYESDTVKWNITISESVGLDQLDVAYRRLKVKTTKLIDLLTGAGVNKEDITVKPINSYPQYNRDGVVTGYKADQNVYALARDIDKIEQLALNPETMFQEGVVIANSNLEYFYSDVDRLKKDLLASATTNARERALQILKDTDLKLGKLLSLRTGVFQITEPFSTATADMGIYDTSSRKKEIKVTVHAEFQLD